MTVILASKFFKGPWLQLYFSPGNKINTDHIERSSGKLLSDVTMITKTNMNFCIRKKLSRSGLRNIKFS